MPTAVSCDVPGALPEAVELALYFVACEALANVAKYAAATAASVRVWRTERGVAIEIADDGIGGADPAPGPGCAASRIASRRSTASSSSRARPARGRS